MKGNKSLSRKPWLTFPNSVLSPAAISLLISVFFLFLIFPSYGQEVGVCDGNSKCRATLSVDASGRIVRNIIPGSCEPCGFTTISCPAGGTESEPNTCEERDDGTTRCNPGQPVCEGAGTATEPTAVTKFRVFVNRGLIITITPPDRTVVKGRKAEYTVKIKNPNPLRVFAILSAQVRQPGGALVSGWTIEFPENKRIEKDAEASLTLKITSTADADLGTYVVTVNAFVIHDGLNIFRSATARYTIADRGSPSVEAAVSSQTGVPGSRKDYNLIITNTDPPGFDATTITIRARAPASGWDARPNQTSISLKPGESGPITISVTPPDTITYKTVRETGKDFTITINATTTDARLSGSKDLFYTINLCGDGVCIPDESKASSFCSIDCPAELPFVCSNAGDTSDPYTNARCEEQTDTGIKFTAPQASTATEFLVCKRDRRNNLDKCRNEALNDKCGKDKDCICSSARGAAECSINCVDFENVYYINAKTADGNEKRTFGNYTFECPDVNLQEIIGFRTNINNLLLRERNLKSQNEQILADNINNPDKVAELRPCIDAESIVINDYMRLLRVLDDTIRLPGKINTNAAKQMHADVLARAADTINQYCVGAKGAIRIKSLEAPAQDVEIGTDINGRVTIENIGNVGYYNYITCSLTSPGGRTTEFRRNCTGPLVAPSTSSFSFTTRANETGRFGLACSVFASLQNDCSLESRHDIKTAADFNVFSKEVKVIKVERLRMPGEDTTDGFCAASGIICAVTTDTPFECASCKLVSGAAENQCAPFKEEDMTQFFRCGYTEGQNQLVGYVSGSSDCIPVEPVQKTADVRCATCGDNILDAFKGEVCEPPGEDNSLYASQTTKLCEDYSRPSRVAYRDDRGYCTEFCQVSLDTPRPEDWRCSVGQCGVTSSGCSDGQTRTRTITTPYGTCSCVQECTNLCGFSDCSCEPPARSLEGFILMPPDPARPRTIDDVVISARTTDPRTAEKIELFVDSNLIASCSAAECSSIGRRYSFGVHTYSATLTNTTAATRTLTGTFSVVDSTGPSIAVDLKPANPTTLDDVNITATAEDDTAVSLVEIIIGSLRVPCNSDTCSVKQKYPAGEHRYAINAFDSQGNRGNLAGRFLIGDRNPPSAAVSHLPARPGISDTVTISASASDAESSINRIEIFVDGLPAKTCNTDTCVHETTLTKGSHTYQASAYDIIGNTRATDQKTVFVNDPPSVTDVSYTGQCVAGGTINVQCSASDPNNNLQFVRLSAWKCNAGSACATTKTTAYYSNTPMELVSGTYTKPLQINQQNGTAIAVSCTATDTDSYESVSNRYPVCEIGGCANPIGFSDIRADKDPAKAGAVTITFRASKPLAGNPSVSVILSDSSVKAVSSSSCTRSGLDYSCRFTISSSFAAGEAGIQVTGIDTESCGGGGTGIFTIDTGVPLLTINQITTKKTTDAVRMVASSSSDDVRSVDIFVDNLVTPAKSCAASTCMHETTYSAGNHFYFASATDAAGNQVRAPASGQYTFTVVESRKPSVTVSHSPAAPGAADSISLSASATDTDSSISRITLFADNAQIATCLESAACQQETTLAKGNHTYYAEAVDSDGNTARSQEKSVFVNDKPAVSSISYTGQCISGGAIIVQCNAEDPNGGMDIRSVKAAISRCNANACASSISNDYYRHADMTAVGNNIYSLPVSINQPVGTGIAASCTATDTNNLQSQQETRYPLCVVDGCANPPGFTGIRIRPETAKQGTVTISFTASKSLASKSASIELSDGSVKQASCSLVSGSYSCSFTVSQNYANGEAAVTISGTDTDNCAGSGTAAFRIDTTPPEINLVITPEEPSASDKVTIAAFASDATGVKNVTLFIDRKPFVCSGSSCSVEDKYLYGRHEYYATSYDELGIIARTATLIFNVSDKIPPSVAADFSPRAPLETDDVTITADAADKDSAIKSVDIIVNNKIVRSCTFSPCGYTAKYSVGRHEYSARATDLGGNAAATEKKGFDVSFDARLAKFSVSHSPSSPSLSDSVVVSASTTDGMIARLDIFVDGRLSISCSSSSCSTAASAYAYGSHKYTAVLTDDRGNTKNISNSFFVGDNIEPAVSVSVSPVSLATDKDVAISATASDTGGSGVKSTAITVDGIQVATCTTSPCSASKRYAFGQHTYTATAIDNAGNAGTRSGSFSVADPIKPFFTSLSHTPKNPKSGDSITISAVAADSESTISKIDIYLDNTLTNTCSSQSCSASATADYGQHSYYAEAFDAGGNSAKSQAQTFLVNNPPAVTNISYTGQCMSGGTINVQCSAADPDSSVQSVKAFIGKCNAVNCASTKTNEYYNNVTMSLSGGVYSLPVQISQQTGTAVAASCTATDTNNLQSVPETRYPLCVVDGCANPPGFTSIRITPETARALTTITFTASKSLKADPTVTIKPGRVGSFAATAKSRSGLSYVYTFNVLPSYTNGEAEAVISGTDNESCSGSGTAIFDIDTEAPSLSLTQISGVQKSTDNINITATASDNALTDITLSIDDIKYSCASSPCTLQKRYAYGEHKYYATATDAAGNTARMPSSNFYTFRVRDTTPPSAGADIDTITPFDDQNVLIKADVIDNESGIKSIDIFVDSAKAKSCTTSPCLHLSKYAAGSHDYWISASDSEGNNITSIKKAFNVLPKPVNTTVYPSNATNVTANVSCSISITRSVCSYNASTNRYDAHLSATKLSVAGHAHGEIADDSTQRLSTDNIEFYKQLASEGVKVFRAVVHDDNDAVLCEDRKEVLCAKGGTSTGAIVDIAKDAPSQTKLGNVPVNITIKSNTDIKGLTFTEYTPATINVSNIKVSGNSSEVSVSGPVRTMQNGTAVNAYTFSADVKKDDVIKISYSADIDKEGEYKLYSKADAAGETVEETKTITATTCPQTSIVYATAIDGTCRAFKNSCSVPSVGWKIVPSCVAEEKIIEKEGKVDLVIIIVVIILAAAGIAAYVFRDKIKNYFAESHEKKILKRIETSG